MALLLCATACDDEKGHFQTPPWDLEEEEENQGGDKEPAGNKPFYIWIDAAANFPDFANSKDNIRRDLEKAADCGFTDVIVDVRPSNGDILYRSELGHQVEWLSAWVGGVYSKIERTVDWDYLQAFIDLGHELGLRVHAGFNTMVGGHANGAGGPSGLLFRDSSKKEWATTYNTASGLRNALDTGQDPFFNPAHPQVQDYLISLLEDLAAYKDLDGIVLDRCRYAGIASDFSELSRRQFMEYLGVDSIRWPEDVLPAGATYWDALDVKNHGPYFKQWCEYRAKVIHDFVEKASKVAHKVHPDITFGVYVGGWYSQYFDVGVNWASPDYDASKDFPLWAGANLKNYGYADHCDHMLIGAYASPSAVYGDKEWTMEGFCRLAKEKIGDACPIVCGGPDVGNWDPKNLYDPAFEDQAVVNSVKACYDACDGYFLFDMIHLKKAQRWEEVGQGIKLALQK